MRMLPKAITILIFLVSTPIFAGSKGFTVIFMNIGMQEFYESKLYDAFTNGFIESPNGERCWGKRATDGKAFELIIKKKLPQGATPDLAKSIWNGDKLAAKKAQTVMRSAGLSYNGNSIDGMYIINTAGNSVSIMALGSRAIIDSKNPSRKISVPWNEEHPTVGAAEFDLALCTVSDPLDVGFSP